MPKIESMRRNQAPTRDLRDGLTSGKAIGKAGAHDPRKNGYSQAFDKGEVAFPGFAASKLNPLSPPW